MPKKRSSLLELTKGRWREFRREPSAFFFVIFMPILWMAILGSAFSDRGPAKAYVGWVEGQPNSTADEALDILKSLESNETIVVRRGTEDDVLTMLKRGQVAVIIRNGATGLAISGDPTSQESTAARNTVYQALQEAAGRKDPLRISHAEVKIPGTRYIDFLIPGLIALSIMTSSLFGTGMLIVSNRRENLLKRYLATPMRAYEYIVSHIFGRMFIFSVEISAILIAGWLMFRFINQGSWLVFLLFALLGTTAFTALAMLCGSRTANPATMNGMTNLISIPMMLVGGIWFSRVHFPPLISEAVRYLPLTALVDGMRKITLEGAGFTSLGFEVTVLAAYALAAIVATKALFKWF